MVESQRVKEGVGERPNEVCKCNFIKVLFNPKYGACFQLSAKTSPFLLH